MSLPFTVDRRLTSRYRAATASVVGVGGLVRVVGTADERTGFDVDEAHVEGGLFQVAELVGMVVADHRRVLRGRSEVLTDREDPAPDAAQIAEGVEQFAVLFAESDHDAGLGRNVRRVGARSIEQFERARVAAAGARHPVQPRHGLRVVIQHVGPGVEDRVQRRFLSLKIRNQDLEAAVRPARARVSRIVAAKTDAPPSGRSSRSTEVITT